ncbi:DUF4139 domain-containing protein [Sphingomonas sp. MMS12-HWE2-04]|uniref:DUF4139 domain-containing protein n=1 Tax=Sphingomonas sp. MMS12-HWE2-04 TaxID=3234199 RepID=UPI00384BDA53
MRRIALLLLSMIAAVPAAAQTLVESERPEAIAVTVYRDGTRARGAMNANWPGGYALITETRTLRVPAGRSVIRFVGVSEGMMPETAIVTGLPRQVNEKNRDAHLLSPSSLIDAYLKRRVMIRRTNRATGKVTEGETIIQAGPQGGVLLTTAEGVEALGCSGLPEGLRYAKVPDDLSAKPTLSVVTDTETAATVTVQLSYLAQGFDWSAHYVARVSEAGDTLDLFAWLTVVNAGSQGFDAARTAAVAGAPNKERSAPLPHGPQPELHLQCWPMDNTSTHPRWGTAPPMPVAEPVFAPAPMAMAEDIVVTGSRDALARAPAMMVVAPEDLGDLKLYRVPEPVTVAAQSRKQVAMIDQHGVTFERIYTGTFEAYGFESGNGPRSEAATRTLRMENRKAKGLGLALPAGGVAVFEEAHGQSLLVGETSLEDRAIGDEVEFETGAASDVRYTLVARPVSGKRQPFTARVTNARATPETFELTIPYAMASSSAKLVERKGRKTWRVTVPANGEASLDFALKLER